MSRLPFSTYASLDRLCCPLCRSDLIVGHEALVCSACGERYPVVNGIPLMLPEDTRRSEGKEAIQQFWGALYHAAYGEHIEERNCASFLGLLDELERLFAHREHLAVTEMPIRDLDGKTVLEIGCGAGAHSALFAVRGAEMTSIDITLERVVATARKLDWVGNEGHFALQADAERLPFKDARFDIVYSNGVLHHTPDIWRAIAEVHRVLKPGGRAVVMLYARHSFEYWVNLFLVQGILRGALFRHRDWLGRVTEWMGRQPAPVLNPETKVFSAAEVRRLFSKFSRVRVRKNSFSFDHPLSLLDGVPRLGSRIRRRLGQWLERRQGTSRAGILIYGAPRRHETGVELALGRWIGFGLNILAEK